MRGRPRISRLFQTNRIRQLLQSHRVCASSIGKRFTDLSGQAPWPEPADNLFPCGTPTGSSASFGEATVETGTCGLLT